MNPTEDGTLSFFPPAAAPHTLEESGLTLDLLVQLLLKTLFFAGTLAGNDLSRRLALQFPVIEPALEQLKTQHNVEIASGALLGNSTYRYRITDAGRARASLFLEQNHYVGVAPVPLEHYRRYMDAFRASVRDDVTPEAVRRAFSHLVLDDHVLDQIGPAVRAGHSMFVYGPPGNGKTVIAQGIRTLLGGGLAIPHALEVEGCIIRFWDPLTHQRLPDTDDADGLERQWTFDRRWVPCHRPLVMVGGELTLEALDLRFNQAVGFYQAPIQALANGGVLVIDDFGRQQCPPRTMLNRWIVPLETGVDFLTLHTGLKFELPFSPFVVFATNLQPSDLVDEAFLRRVQYKVFAENPTVEHFLQIFKDNCARASIPYDEALVRQMLTEYFRPRKIALRACQPRDVINHVLSLCDYAGEPRRLTAEILLAACDSYFVSEHQSQAVYV
jgi:predicted ATPase with chaperone activity